MSLRGNQQLLRQMLKQTGLEGRVRIGVPHSPSVEPHPRDLGAHGPSFPPDQVLRPLERANDGALIEIAGAPSSGRTSLAYRMAAGTVARGELVGWVDLPNMLDPRYLRRTGLDLNGLLWVRPDHARTALRAAELLVKTGFSLVVIDLADTPARELNRLGAGAWTRLQRALRATRTTGVVLGPPQVSSTYSTLGLHSRRTRGVFEHGLFEGIDARVEVVRRRAGPPGAVLPFRVSQRAH